MTSNKDTGHILLIAGIALLLFTLYSAYSLYAQALAGNLFQVGPTKPITVNVTTTNTNQQSLQSALLSSIANQLVSSMPIQQYSNDIFAVLLLGIFASIGFKVANLGINMLKVDVPQQTQQKKQ